MQLVFLLIGIIGLIMFIFGIKILIEYLRNKISSELKLTENEINFEKVGIYSICVVGGGYANNLGTFEAKITHNETEINTIEKQLKFKFHYKGRLATEFYMFRIEFPGMHKISIKNIEDLEVKESMLFSKRLFQKKLPIEKIDLIIKETSSSSRFIIGLIITILGINIATWGFIFAYYPQLFN
jgi:hypothetical protein